MVGNKVITPVNHPTDWVHNVQLVEKKNDIRVCLDPKPLNKCIKREHFLIPTFDDVTSQLANKCIFTVLDLSSGFWQMELDEPSSNLTTFMTPFGRYKVQSRTLRLKLCARNVSERNGQTFRRYSRCHNIF